MPCVQGFGGSKSIVGFPLHSHSCSSLEQPPDHTRRITQNSQGETEEVASYQIFTVCTVILVFACWQCVKIRDIRKQINERLTMFWLSEPEELEFNLQLLISEVKSS